jgi:hypothetical protein
MNKRFRSFWCGAALLAAGPSPVFAQSAASETSVATPDLNLPANALGDERKYFVFHKPGVTVEQATSDLGFCWRFLPHGFQRPIPSFVPWQRSDGVRKAPNTIGPYGLVGDIIGGIVAGPLERSMRQSRMFRCMVPRGYARYRTSEALWKEINMGDAAQAIRIQALIAAGPVPPTPRVLP